MMAMAASPTPNITKAHNHPPYKEVKIFKSLFLFPFLVLIFLVLLLFTEAKLDPNKKLEPRLKDHAMFFVIHC